MGCICSPCRHEQETPSPPIPTGITRICVAGGKMSPHVARARMIAAYICKKYSSKYESWFYFTSPGACGEGYFPYIVEKTKNVTFPEHLKGHSTMPLIWFENGADKKWTVIGGRQDFADWAMKEFPNDKELVALASTFKVSQLCHATCCCAFDEEDDPEYFSTCLKNQKYDPSGSLIANQH